MEEIILVTGCDLTKSWANVAFLGDQDDSQASFGVRVESPDLSITFQFSPENAQGAVLHHGPEGKVRCMSFVTIDEITPCPLEPA